jgi:hypothetical protein
MAVGLLKIDTKALIAKQSDTATLLRAAAVVGNWSHISNHIDANAQSGQGAN